MDAPLPSGASACTATFLGHGLPVSKTLPKTCDGVAVIKDVVAVAPGAAVHLAEIFRDAIIRIHRTRASEEGKAAKTSALYEYLRSEEFTRAIAFVEYKVSELAAALEGERTSDDEWWSTRSHHCKAILRQATGIDDRLQQILGTTTGPRHLRATARI